MSNTKPFNQSELIRLALAGLDTQIAELQEKRAQLAAISNQHPVETAVIAATAAAKKGGMSDEAKAKISAAAKKRWAKVRRAKADSAKSAPTAKKASAKKTSVKARGKNNKTESSTSAEKS